MSFVLVSGFHLQTAAPSCHSFVFLLAPQSFVPFCAPPSLPSPESLLSDRQWTAGKVGSGPGPGLVLFGVFGKMSLTIRECLVEQNLPKRRFCGLGQSGSRAGGLRGLWGQSQRFTPFSSCEVGVNHRTSPHQFCHL